MVRLNEIRRGELAVTNLPPATDAGLVLGRIHTPWTDRVLCPRQGRLDGPICHIDIFEPWVPALDGITRVLDSKVCVSRESSFRPRFFPDRTRC
jgi:tRNA (adenine37-N6)-methyltransferase